MDKETRNLIFNTTQAVRRLLEEEFALQLEGTFDIHRDGRIAEKPGAQLTPAEKLVRQRIVDAIHHRQAVGQSTFESVRGFLSEAVFTFLNRLAALKMMEARGLVLPCVSEGDQSRGFKEFSGLAPGLIELPDKGYRLYLECLFDEIGREVGALFDRTDAASQLWPRRKALEAALEKLNTPELSGVWAEDETIGWIYQYFNDEAERRQMREESAAPRNSREMAVRNQFFTPRYVVEFLTDNTLGRIWYEMTQGKTRLKEQCRYLVRRPDEVFLGGSTHVGGEFQSKECIAAAQRLQLGKEPDFAVYHVDRIQDVIDLAHTVNGYYRLPESETLWGGWYETRVGAASRGEYLSRSTQEILDLMFIVCRNDRATEGNAAGQPWFIDLANEVRRRALHSRQENLPQEELLKQPVFVPFRPIKDPRTILMLDPACGSMHFGLYAFDLFLAIYEEAWALEENDRFRMERPANLRSLHDSYVDKSVFLLDVPRLVIEHNIHGIDIDPRAAQIAKLSLWLRAQRAWHQGGVKPTERPGITKSNIVCAEPMPGEKELLQEFVNQQFPAVERPAFSLLLGKIFDHMKLAGEAGSLLRIEKEIKSTIAEARAMAYQQSTPKQDELFPDDETREQVEFDLRGLNDEQFWQAAEERIYEALQTYAELANDSGGFQRRLFAEDAAQGFAFIDLCRKRYDVVVMNPPFGESAKMAKDYIAMRYPRTKNDVYAAFVEEGIDRLAPHSFLGALTSRSGFFLTSFREWREEILLTESKPVVLADLGYGVLDSAMVETACYVVESSANLGAELIWFRLISQFDKGQLLEEWIVSLIAGKPNPSTGMLSPESLRNVPGSPFAYWVSDKIRKLFITLERMESLPREIRIGPSTGDDTRYIRIGWEVPFQMIGREHRWVWLNKGGTASPFFFDYHLVIDWDQSRQTFRGFVGRPGRPIERPNGLEQFFRPGISWPLRTQAGFNTRAVPSGLIFSHKGPTIFAPSPRELLALLAISRSRVFRLMVGLQISFGSYEVGAIQRTVLPRCDAADTTFLASLAAKAWSLSASPHSLNETARNFVHPLGCNNTGQCIGDLVDALKHECEAKTIAVAEIQESIDDFVLKLYGLIENDIHADEAAQLAARSEDETEVSEESGEHPAETVSGGSFSSSVLSYAVGTVFGRWNINYATGEFLSPETSDPFAPLPVCAPGMLQGDDGLPISIEEGKRLRDTGKYPTDVAWGGILVDDPNHPSDVVRNVENIFELLWKDNAEATQHEACGFLGVKTLRDWFRKPSGFFADHLKRYSKSRRQAPIYWPLSSPNGLYTVWLYYHRLTPDTLFTVLRDYVKPKLEFEERRAFALRQEVGPSPSPSQRRDLAEAEELVEDLLAFRAELERVAPLFRPNLNDGVIINHAPLWRMIGLPKWRKDCQSIWEDLMKGEYDWAHLALHLWPERVIPKCAEDRSLAIAHGFDEVFWQEDQSKPGKWTSKKGSATEMQKLISERTSAAVKSALEALLQAGGSKASSARKGKRGKE